MRSRVIVVTAVALVLALSHGCKQVEQYQQLYFMSFFITSTGSGKGADFGGLTGADGKTRTTEYPAINAHGESVASFSKALLEKREPSPSGIDGLRSVQLTDAMARSAWDGVHVRLAY